MNWVNELWLKVFSPQPPCDCVHIFFVRTGQYHRVGGGRLAGSELTEAGERQAQIAADAIRHRAGGQPVMVLDPKPLFWRPHYTQTAKIIAAAFNTDLVDGYYGLTGVLVSPGTTSLHQFQRRDLSGLYQRFCESSASRAQQQAASPALRVVMVVDGSSIERWLEYYNEPSGADGGDETKQATGRGHNEPPFGSVGELVVAYNPKTGEILERRFVSEPSEPPAAPTT